MVSAESHMFEFLDFAGGGLRSSTHKNLSLYSLLAALPFKKIVSGLERGLSKKEHQPLLQRLGVQFPAST